MMPSLSVGLFCESRTDCLILKVLLRRIFEGQTGEIEALEVFTRGGAFHDFARALPNFLHKFYKHCIRLVVACADNDGKVDLTQPNSPPEDPKHPRHTRHVGNREGKCRYCILEERVKDTTPNLRYIESKDGTLWPVIVTVPVEAIESWLVTARALVTPGAKVFRGEDLPSGQRLKMEFYGKPFVTTPDVESKALPLLNDPALSLDDLARYSPSFGLFLNSLRSLNLS
jgi:hypothetical protein